MCLSWRISRPGAIKRSSWTTVAPGWKDRRCRRPAGGMNNSTLHMRQTIFSFLMAALGLTLPAALGLTAGAQSAAPAQSVTPAQDRYQANWQSLQRYTTPDWF